MYSEDGSRLAEPPEPVYSTIRYTDKLLDFLADREGSEQPFFAVYAPTAVQSVLPTSAESRMMVQGRLENRSAAARWMATVQPRRRSG